MNPLTALTSSVGKKFIMAVTGLALVLFVLLHMIGNLQVFLGPEAINRYGAFLQGNVELLWPARISLLAIVSLHIWSAVKLTVENRAARPKPYAQQEIVAASYASRTMLMSGLIILAFIVYHLMHFTLQTQEINFTGRNFTDLKETLPDGSERHDVFAMMILGFRQPMVAAFYFIAMFLLFTHLSHGVGAMFQSLGWKSQERAQMISCGARAVSWLIFLGYISIPTAILLGYGSNYLVSKGLLQ